MRHGRCAGGGAGAGGGKGSGAQSSRRRGNQFAEEAGRIAQLGTEIRHAVGGSDHAIARGTKSVQPGTRNIFCERARLRYAFLPAGGGTRPEFRHRLRCHCGGLQSPQRSRAGRGECTQGVRAAGESKRTGAAPYRGILLPDCDGRAGEGGGDLRTVATDLPEGLFCMGGLGVRFHRPWKLGKGSGGSTRGNPPGTE